MEVGLAVIRTSSKVAALATTDEGELCLWSPLKPCSATVDHSAGEEYRERTAARKSSEVSATSRDGAGRSGFSSSLPSPCPLSPSPPLPVPSVCCRCCCPAAMKAALCVFSRNCATCAACNGGTPNLAGSPFPTASCAFPLSFSLSSPSPPPPPLSVPVAPFVAVAATTGAPAEATDVHTRGTPLASADTTCAAKPLPAPPLVRRRGKMATRAVRKSWSKGCRGSSDMVAAWRELGSRPNPNPASAILLPLPPFPPLLPSLLRVCFFVASLPLPFL
mmetsp:Transcript_32467/g.66257  ORF Transcript_32467/g.66257 Transcript_32467/m.66257 type:complete len:276 (-) Transcript_32467:422-1249(-)